MKDQLSTVLDIIRHNLEWEVITSEGVAITQQPVRDFKNLLRVHASGINVRALTEPAGDLIHRVNQAGTGTVCGLVSDGSGSLMASTFPERVNCGECRALSSAVPLRVVIERATMLVRECPPGVIVDVVEPTTGD